VKRNLKGYAMRVVHLDGRPINWKNPPDANDMVKWTKRTTGGKEIRGSFRTICAMDRLNRLCYLKFGVGLQIIQSAYNTTVSASAGPHDFDCCFDVWIPGVDPWRAQRFLRRNGFGCWVRKPPAFGWHLHGFVLPVPEGTTRSDDFKVRGFKVGIYVDGGYSTRGRLVTSSQIQDYYSRAFGLSGQHTPFSDRSWYPKNIPATVFDLRRFVNNRAEEQRRAA
jgi:hypothetical protein